MQKQLLWASLLAGLVTIAGCQTAPSTPAAPAKAEMNSEAKSAIAQAESDVKEAQKAGALWTTADEALKAAKEAGEKGDNATAVKKAKTASAQAKLGLAQKNEPLMTLK